MSEPKPPRKNPPGQERALVGLAVTLSALDDLIDYLDQNELPDDDACDSPCLHDAEGLHFMCNQAQAILASTVLNFSQLTKDVLPALQNLGLPVTQDRHYGLRLDDSPARTPAPIVTPPRPPSPPLPKSVSVRDKFRWQYES